MYNLASLAATNMSNTNPFTNHNSLEWWDKQAQKDPQNAGVLSVFGKDKVARGFRFWRECEVFKQMVPSWKEKRVLEIGCGAGRWAFWLANTAAEVIAIDFSPEMIRLAEERRVKDAINNLHFSVCPAQEYTSTQPFDLIYLSGVDQYLTDEELSRLLANCEACLAPGGTLVDRVTLSLGETLPVETRSGYQCIYRNIQDLLNLFQQSGFQFKSRRPSHEKPRLDWMTENRRLRKHVESIFKRSPALGCRLVLWITKFLNLFQPLKINSERSHDFLVFIKKCCHHHPRECLGVNEL